jgi:phage shock protein A
MGRRIALIFKAKANKVLDKAEDPRETLDYSYEKQLELLTKVRRGVADVATSRKRLEIQMQQLQAEEEKLQLASQRLQAKVDAFRTRKETIKATYTAAEAQTKIGEAMSGISEEMGDVGMAMQRAEDKTQQMQARAGAIDELIASGALDDASQSLGGKDDIQRELDSMSAGSDVELELAKLKGELPAGSGSAPQALPEAAANEEKK